MTSDPIQTVAYQGEAGANSHIACSQVFSEARAVAFPTFEAVFQAVREGLADRAMIPIENSIAGRVADIHHLIPFSRLHIVGEYFLPVNHQLLIKSGGALEDVRTVHSHVHALGQCRNAIAGLGLTPVIAADTAGAARELAQKADYSCAAIATTLAAEIYGLTIARANIEDEDHNITRFIIMARQPAMSRRQDVKTITSFVFRVRNVPAALYKALGGFATNGVNMTKLESYQLGGAFMATQFYADVEGHPDDRPLRLALEELKFFTSHLDILGVYEAAPVRGELMDKAARRAASDRGGQRGQ